jgi:outer membrane protein assembly factor BamE (lipoprotein component of BamABCDE complex)
MKKVKILLSVVAMSFLMAGCAAKSGNEAIYKMNKADMSRAIVVGKTTKNDITRKLGNPMEVDFTAQGDEKWTYKHVYSSAKAINYVPIASSIANGTNDRNRMLVIIFNKNSTVKQYLYSISDGETMGGLIN